MTIPTTPSFSRSGRSSTGGKHTERISTDVSDSLLCDLADAQELFYESLTVPLHDEPPAKRQPLELEPMAPKRSARVPRDTEPCNLVSFLGIVSGGAAAALAALALAGWTVGAVVDAGLVWVGVR